MCLIISLQRSTVKPFGVLQKEFKKVNVFTAATESFSVAAVACNQQQSKISQDKFYSVLSIKVTQ